MDIYFSKYTDNLFTLVSSLASYRFRFVKNNNNENHFYFVKIYRIYIIRNGESSNSLVKKVCDETPTFPSYEMGYYIFKRIIMFVF